ncbi:MAG: hypothetical protein HFF39_06940 [Lawsonibacter sp.]|nr:hypothetical protein [Lawsonibacter sp.]
MTGKLSDERFAKLSAAYEAEQAELKQSVESLSVIVEASEAQAVNVRSFLKIVKRIQRIGVHYNFIGEVNFSPEFRR